MNTYQVTGIELLEILLTDVKNEVDRLPLTNEKKTRLISLLQEVDHLLNPHKTDLNPQDSSFIYDIFDSVPEF